VPPGSVIGAVAPGGRYVPGGEEVFPKAIALATEISVTAAACVGALASAAVYVPLGSAIGADAPAGRYVTGVETIFAAPEAAAMAGI
jgi:hypothetical protein